jgi:putative salt-induced outer membrane protein YdiY
VLLENLVPASVTFSREIIQYVVGNLRLVAAFFIFSFSSRLFADQVILKNGDRLTGTIVKSDGKSVVIKSEFAGDVTVQWPAIQEIKSTQPLHVGLSNGQTVVGPVNTTDGDFAINTSANGTVTMPKTAVVAMRSDAEEAAYQKSLHPGLTQGWAGGANVGFALTPGNSQTKNLALAFTADRKTQTDHLGLYLNSVYATNDAPGATPATTANTIQSGARFDRNLTQLLFAFVGADFQTDTLQDLNLRSVLGGGLGLHVIKNDRTTLDFLGGINYTRENYTTFNRNFAAVTIGEELSQKLGAATLLTQKLYFYPDLSDTGEYRGVFNFGTVTKINKWFGWENAFGDIYVTNPHGGEETKRYYPDHRAERVVY